MGHTVKDIDLWDGKMSPFILLFLSATPFSLHKDTLNWLSPKGAKCRGFAGRCRYFWRDVEWQMLLRPRLAWSLLSLAVSPGVWRHQLKAAEAAALTTGFLCPGTSRQLHGYELHLQRRSPSTISHYVPRDTPGNTVLPKRALNDHFQYKPPQNWYKNSLQHETIQKCSHGENWRNLPFHLVSSGHKVLWPCCACFPPHSNSERLNSSKGEGGTMQLRQAWQELAALEKILMAFCAFTYFCTGRKISSGTWKTEGDAGESVVEKKYSWIERSSK